MSNVLLCILLVIVVIGALFTTLIALGVGSMCQKAQEDIRELRTALNEVNLELARVGEFNKAVTDCMSGIGRALDVINERTDWLDGINDQIQHSFMQNKDRKKS